MVRIMRSFLKWATLGLVISSTAAWSETCYEQYGCLHSGYLAVSNKYTFLNDELGVLLGGHASYLWNSSLGIGVGGYGLVDDVSVDKPSGEKASFYYAGGLIQWIFAPMERMHGGLALLGGAGEIGAKGDESNESWDIYVLEPEWFFQINIAPWMQVDWGVSYRHIWGRGTRKYIASRWDVSHLSLNLGMRFGWFNTQPRNP